jgi:serine/threonine-protein kinase
MPKPEVPAAASLAEVPSSAASPAAPPEPAPAMVSPAPVRIGEAPAGMAEAPPAGAASPGRRRDRVRRWALRSAAALGVPLGIVLGGTALLRPHPSAPAAVTGPDPRRVAVLYFDDLSPRRDLGYFADGLTEMLITGLTGVEELEVISTHGVRPFRGGDVPLDSVAAALGVGTIVEGSVRRAGEEVRVAVRVVDAGTRAPLGGRVVVRPLGEVSRLEDELAAETAELLRRRVGRTLRMRANEEGTRSAAARLAALQAAPLLEDARALERTRDSADAGRAVRLLLRADGLLDEAQRQDPGWTEPAVRRGWVSHALARMGPPGEAARWRARGLAHAERALRRSPGNARALELRGAVHWLGAVQNQGDARALEAAEADLRAAAAAEPGLASAWVRLSQLLRYGGRFAEAELAARRALEADAWLDEAVGGVQQLYGAALAREDYAQARALCDAGRLRRPADWWFTECALTLLREERAGTPPADSAWRLVAALERLDPPAVARAAGRGYSPLYRRMVAAAVSARAGDGARARAEAERARRAAGDDAELRLSLRYDDAYLRLALGDTAGARAELDAYAAARPALREYLARDPLFGGVWPTRSPSSGR